MTSKLTLLLTALAANAAIPAAVAVERDATIVVAQQNTTNQQENKKKPHENVQPRPGLQQGAPGSQQPRTNAQAPNRQEGTGASRPGGERENKPAAQGQPRQFNPSAQQQTNQPERRNQPAQNQSPTQNRQPTVQQAPTTNQPERRNQPAQNQPPTQNRQPTMQQAPTANQPERRNQPAQNQPPTQNRQPTVQQAPTANQPERRNQPAQNQPPARNRQPTVQQGPTTNQPAFRQPNQPPASVPAAAADNRRIDQLRAERKETHEGNRTVIREDNRTIVRENNVTIIRHDDSDRFRRGAANVQVERHGDITSTVLVRPSGIRVVNEVDASGRLLRRTRWVNGREIVLIDNRYRSPTAGFGFIVALPPPVIRIPRERYIVDIAQAPPALIYDTLVAPPVEPISQRYTLDQVRFNVAVRDRMPRVDIDTITFDTGSWQVAPDQAQLLAPIAAAMKRAIEKSPNEVYLIEGHTDAVGSNEDNLSLSDRRAEAVAEVLTDNFQIPPENLTTQGYGEQFLKVQTPGPERANRRVTVRRITPLLMGQAQQETQGQQQQQPEPQDQQQPESQGQQQQQ